MDAMNRGPGRAVRALLPVLLLLSGFCGISYEILYAKLLGNALGNPFAINATVLLTFLFGIGWGTREAHRFRGRLWAIEAGIGGSAALIALGLPALERLLYATFPAVGGSLAAAALVSLAVLSVPAFLIGCSLPLFADYLAALRATRVFSVTYAIYNLGAALTALVMEFVLLRHVGLRSTTLILATLNGLVALGLLGLDRTLHLPPLPERRRFAARVLLALALASVASAMLQLAMIKIAEFVLGPFNETFALVLATVLLGLTLGAFLAGRFRWSFHGAVLLGLAGTVLILVSLPLVARGFALLHPLAVRSYPGLVALKLGFVLALLGLPATGFGATIPALLHGHRHVARESGQLLFCSASANALGFLLLAFVLHPLLDYGPLLAVIVVTAAAAVVVERGWATRSARAAAALAAAAGVALAFGWNERLLYVSHTAFDSLRGLERAERTLDFDERFKGAEDVFAITRFHGEPYFFINGQISIPLESPSEKVVGALSAMVSPRTDRALVLGVGSGATAGTVGLLFDHTDAVEINRVVLDNLDRMERYNFGIESQPQTRLVHDDGIHFIRVTPERYSLILNTVTSPLYFSSSKLYTVDFFELVRRRLTPDGVYVTWLDVNIGDRGCEIVLEALSRVFPHAWMLYIKSGYFLLAASNDELAFSQFGAVAGNARLGDDLAERHTLPTRLLVHSLLLTDAYALRAVGPVPLNTRDFPALEYHMARGDYGFARLPDRLRSVFDLGSVQSAIARVTPWEAGESALNAELRLPEKSRVRTLLFERLLPERSDWIAFDRAALALAGESGRAGVFYKYGKLLRQERRPLAAAEAFARAFELDPQDARAAYYLGRTRYELGECEAALPPLLAAWEQARDTDVPLVLASCLARLGRFEPALDWLDAAQLLGSRSDAGEVAFWRGFAYEKLGRAQEAEQSYVDALGAEKRYASAQQALDRLRSRSQVGG